MAPTAALGLLAAAIVAAAPAGPPSGGAVSPASAAKVGALPSAPPGEVVLTGAGATRTLTSAEIAATPHAHVAFATHDGQTVNYAGPLVSDLLRSVRAPLGVRLHGTGVNDVVFVTGADRFRAVFSLAELDPSFHRGAKVILADQADGKPIAGKEGPYRLVIDGDVRPARSVYAVVSIEVKHLP